MNRKLTLVITLLIMGISIVAVLIHFSNKEEPVENIATNEPFLSVPIDSFDDICERSDTIVKAKYIKREKFDGYTDIFVFKVEEDYIGNVDEKQIHVYEEKANSFIQGKSYYLFMSSVRNNIYPHVVYARTYANLLVGESGAGDSQQYTFYNGVSFGLDKVGDISKYIETEIVEKKAYMKTESESLNEAILNADAIYKIKMESVESFNRFVASCTYTVKETLKERYPVVNAKELPSILVPSDAKKGDQFIVLLKYNENTQSYGYYSAEHYIYPLRSSEARNIIKSLKK